MNKNFSLFTVTMLLVGLFLLCPVFADEGVEDQKDTNVPAGNVLKAHIASSDVRASLHFDKKEIFSPNGIYHISIKKGDRWVSVGEIQSDKYLRKGIVDLTEWSDSDEVSVRIKQEGGGAAHIDSITLNGQGPSNYEGFLAKKLSTRDNDVIDSYGETIEVTFSDVPLKKNKPLLLELTARVEPETISKVPFHYPMDNLYKEISAESIYYTYELGSNEGKLTIDGELAAERLGEPFFAEFSLAGTGHPDATTYGWVFDDGEYLFVAIDFLGDNTMDGGKDYTKVYVNTPEGPREFKVTAEHLKWGMPGFTYTERIGWQHKVYEFAVPLVEIGGNIESGQPLELAFAAYGTCAPPAADINSVAPADPNGVTPDSGASGTTFTFSVVFEDTCLVAAPNASIVWIDLDSDGEVDTAKTPLFLSPPSGTTTVLALLTLTALSLLIWLFRRRIRRARVLFVSILAVAILIAGSCPGSGGGDGTTEELYAMTWVNSIPAVEWDTGEDFEASVQIEASAGNYTFRFLFVDAADFPVTTGTATGNLTVTIE